MKKAGYFFFSFLPLFASIALQFASIIPMMEFYLIRACFSNLLAGKKVGYSELMMQLVSSSESSTSILSLIFALSGILLFSFWYTRQFNGNLRELPEGIAKPGLILGLILLIPGLQMISAVLTSLSASFFPGWMDFYEKLMESAGLTQDPSLMLILYAVVFGPIAEELTFRGVVLSSARKAMPFWAANLFQAFLFGVFHLNLIQGIYAFMIGLFFGCVCSRGGSIYLSISLHILFNAWGTFMPTDSSLYTNPIYFLPFFLGSILFGIFGFYLFWKNTAKTAVNHSPDFSDIY